MPNARVGVRLGPPDEVTAWIAQGAAFDAAGADSLWLDLREHPDLDPYVLTAALAAVTYRSRLVLLPGEAEAEAGSKVTTLAAVCRGRLVLGVREEDGAYHLGQELGEEEEEAEARRWEPVEVPDGRAAWRTALTEATERGVHGLIVPADPRLLDLLRNPDEEIDRRDLQLASG
jgi:hypothetical protein